MAVKPEGLFAERGGVMMGLARNTLLPRLKASASVGLEEVLLLNFLKLCNEHTIQHTEGMDSYSLNVPTLLSNF